MNLSEDEIVQELLERFGQDERPTDTERARIEEKMWAAATGLGSSATNVADVTELVRLSTDPELSGWQAKRWMLVPAMAAAAVLLIIAVSGVFSQSEDGDRLETTEADTNDEQPERDGSDGFVVPAGHPDLLTIASSGPDFVEITVDPGVIPAGGPHGTSSIFVARPSTLFDGMDAETWSEANGVELRLVAARFDGEPIEAWVLTVDGDTAAELGCGGGDPCVPFGELASGDDLLTLDAKKFNSIHLIPTADPDRPLVLFSTGLNVFGTGYDVLIALQDDILQVAAPLLE